MFALGDFLSTVGINWSKGQAATTRRFNDLLAQTRGGPHGQIVNEVVLRSQMQAIYSADNIGHFGLNLDRYAHFTSPIPPLRRPDRPPSADPGAEAGGPMA